MTMHTVDRTGETTAPTAMEIIMMNTTLMATIATGDMTEIITTTVATDNS